MLSILFEPALSFDGQRLDVVDLVLAGLVSGTWSACERDSAAGVAAERELDARGDGPANGDLRAALRAFRYERGLISREDLESWLAARDVAPVDWRGHVRRTLARKRVAGEGPPEAAEAVLRVDAILSGALGRCATQLVEGAAAARALAAAGVEPPQEDGKLVQQLVALAQASRAAGSVDGEELERRAGRIAAFDAARRRLELEVAAPEAISHCVGGHLLDWLLIETEELEVDDEDVAREARMCVEEDGAGLAEVGAAVGLEPRMRSRVFAETADELRTPLVAARPGELVGPIAVDGRFLVARVLAKRPPSEHDPAVFERARTQLLAEAVARHSAGKVSRHVAL